MRKNIIIAPCGNKSQIFKDHWLKDSDERDFDICLLFYHAEIDNPGLYAGVDYFFHLKDFKFRMIHELLTSIKPEFIEQYEYFYFIDDDIVIDTKSINKMFLTSRALDLWISQASLTRNSYCSWPILKTNKKCYVRFLGQLEVMAPLFSRYALKKCLHSFNANESSWGLDSVWSKLLGYPRNKIAIADAIQMEHIHPVGSGELYTKIQEDPHDDWDAITDAHGAHKTAFHEYGRYLIIDNRNNAHLRTIVRLKGWGRKLKQSYLDYGLSYRIKNKLRL